MKSRRLPLFGLAVACLALAMLAGLPLPESTAAQTAQQPEVKLPVVFDKPMPESIDDLKAIEAHMDVLIARVMPAVVNVKIGAQGSGVVISEDGYVLTAGHVSGQPGRECTITF